MNLLGVTVRCASGELLGVVPNHSVEASVHLIRAVCVPGRTSVFAEAEISEPHKEGEALVFEHDRNTLAESGLISHDSLVTVRSGNKVLVPLHNQGTLTAHKNAVLCLFVEKILKLYCVRINVSLVMLCQR